MSNPSSRTRPAHAFLSCNLPIEGVLPSATTWEEVVRARRRPQQQQHRQQVERRARGEGQGGDEGGEEPGRRQEEGRPGMQSYSG